MGGEVGGRAREEDDQDIYWVRKKIIFINKEKK